MTTEEFLRERSKMNTKEKIEERIFIVECIRLYEKLPALWNTKLKDYSNRNIKNKQYEVLLRKYKQRYPEANKIDVIKKFNSLRTNFRKEIKKLEDAKCSGHTEEPTLWYFNQMKFLLNIEESSPQQFNILNDPELNEIKVVKEKEYEPKRKKNKPDSSTDELVRLAIRRLKHTQDSLLQIATVWSNKLSKMDRNQRIFAEKVINEVVYNGELGLLDYSTTLTNLNSIRNRTSVLPTNKNKTVINASDSSNEQQVTDNTPNYVSDINDELSDEESGHSAESYIVEDYDPLDESVKLED